MPLNVPMPRGLHARMKSKAAITGRTIRRFVIEAVEEKLEREGDSREGARKPR